MKRGALIQILVLLLFTLPNAEGAPNDGPSRTGVDLFAKANTEFAAGNFKGAIADYNALVGSGEWSANLFYDLGNAYFRHGDFGRAILNYDRALRLDRHHPEADANLRITRDQTRSLELAPSVLERYVNFGTADFFAVTAAILFWLTIILLILRPGRRLWTIAGMFLTAVCGFAAYASENGTNGRGLAIVIAENTEARVATVDSARSVLALPAGSEVLILQERGDWNYAALPNDQRGWIAANAVEKVRL
jgi:tetratricopeptide (TPR) repeat protein